MGMEMTRRQAALLLAEALVGAPMVASGRRASGAEIRSRQAVSRLAPATSRRRPSISFFGLIPRITCCLQAMTRPCASQIFLPSKEFAPHSRWWVRRRVCLNGAGAQT